jgi:hypothetical protein
MGPAKAGNTFCDNNTNLTIDMEPLNQSRTFPLSLVYDGDNYEGVITPSAETGKNGMPVYFRVTLGNEFFAYLCCGDTGWTTREQKGNSNGLVQAIAGYIRSFYL